ncbi:hypothetical protein F4604DRAFT_1679357 [Suillus subluteus]|nr:hypothetical protein F4604DRAFT_1679357 [Suillus subluteus]
MLRFRLLLLVTSVCTLGPPELGGVYTLSLTRFHRLKVFNEGAGMQASQLHIAIIPSPTSVYYMVGSLLCPLATPSAEDDIHDIPPDSHTLATSSESYYMAVVCHSEEDNDVHVIRIRSRVPPALTSSTTTSESYQAFCHDLDGGLNELSEYIFSILSKLCFLGDMLTLLTLCDKNIVYVSLAPSYAHAEDHDEIVFYEGERSYAKVAGAIADDCGIFFYHSILYNIPANTNSTPPFTCITSGCYIGVFSGEDYVPMVEGITDAVFFEVEPLEVGERALRNAIERSPGQIPVIRTIIH